MFGATFPTLACVRGAVIVWTVLLFAGGLIVNSVRSGSAVSETYLAEAVPEAAGSNVVNVILVDFRAFDTLGEITVLVAAALGAAGLIVPIVRGSRAAR